MPDGQRTRPHDAGNAGAPTIAEAEIVFGAAAKRVKVCDLPAGAVILDRFCQVITAFNAGVSNLLTLGHGAIGAGTADDFLAAADITEGTPGMYPATRGIPLAPLATATEVYAYYTPGDGAATTGAARFFVVFARLAANG